MRALRFLNVAILSLLVGSAGLLYAQDEKQQEDKSRQEEPKSKQDEAKPPRQNEAEPSKQDKEMQKQEQKRDQEQSRDQAMPEKNKQEHPDMKGDRQGQEQSGMRGDHAHPAGKGGHIPDDKFKAHFGHGHHFRAQGVIVQGQPQFQYGGYTFELVDPWPADWAYTDDCYIDYIDGEYFLFDLLHPGVRIALFVVL